jgi:asparagine synthase (glutamine-hydrolysing)
MCGIVGILARDGANVAPEVLQRATASLSHRGPDDSGTIILPGRVHGAVEVGLGHRRLAIIDLSSQGHQPMHDPATGNWIVFNGEIYNFQEIRKELEAEGVALTSRSDTEVLLKGYARWGKDCLRCLRGIFAFAIWDSVANRLFLARDPMGVKPLYYSSAGQYFVFASEVRTILSTDLVPRRLDPAAALQYLSFGSICEPNTAIQGVRLLRAGHSATWENGEICESSYWGPGLDSLKSKSGKDKEKEAVEGIRQELDDSIQMQTVSDVPVGVFLSGGIDSSVIVAALSRKTQPSTFSIIFREAEYSEAQYSRAVAKRFHTDHHEILLSAGAALDSASAAVKAMDQPTIDGLNTFVISQAARNAGVKVVLSGLGGDELFGGYNSFRTVPRMETFLRYWKHLPAHRPLGQTLFAMQSSSDKNRKLHALTTENGRLLHPYFLSRLLFTPAQLTTLAASHDSWTDAQAPLREALSATTQMDAINRVSYLESRCYMLNTLLRDADVMSMAHGLEIRVPLIDHRLTEKMFAIPGALKLKKGIPKALLVGAIQEQLPHEIVYRKKRGFTLPFENWLRNDMRRPVEESIRATPGGPLATVLKKGAAEQVWQDFLLGRTSWSRPWSLHVLQRWCDANHIISSGTV